MRKVLVYGLNEGVGGIETFLYQYCRHMANDFEFHFVKMKEKVQYEGELKEHGFLFHKITARRENPFQYLKDLDRLFSENDFDVIWMNVISLSQISLLQAAKKHHVEKRIVHIHNSSHVGGSISRVLHGINKHFIAAYATDFWGSSKAAIEWAFPNKIISKSVVVNNALDFNEYYFRKEARQSIRQSMNLNDEKIIISVSRLAPEKNIMKSLEIFMEILKRDSTYRFFILGSGKEEKKIRLLIKEHSLEKYIFLIGSVDNVGDYLSSADFYISTSFNEGFGTSLLEAQINGLPCIIPKRTFPDAAIINDNIFIFEMNDSLDEYIFELQLFLQENVKMRREGYKEELLDFDMEKNIDKLIELLNK